MANYKTTMTTANITLGAGGSGGTTYTVPWTTSSSWNNGSVLTVSAAPSPSLQVSGDADIRGNLTVQGANVTEILSKIQDRLAILTPDPKLLTKYEALREAYEHYKTLEALCVDSDSQKG
jgi:hypothetical protein